MAPRLSNQLAERVLSDTFSFRNENGRDRGSEGLSFRMTIVQSPNS